MDLTLHSLVNTKDLKILIRTEVQLLDEATSHLDVATERAVNAAIQRLQITRIVLAHRPEDLASAQRVIDLSTLRESAGPTPAGQRPSPRGPGVRPNEEQCDA